jgi:hypothetical protein
MFNGRRQPSCDGTSRMTRECQVRICERLGVKFRGPTRQTRPSRDVRDMSILPSISAVMSQSRSQPHLSMRSPCALRKKCFVAEFPGRSKTIN